MTVENKIKRMNRYIEMGMGAEAEVIAQNPRVKEALQKTEKKPKK